MHIALIIGSTFGVYLLNSGGFNSATYFRTSTASIVLTGILNYYLSCNIIFILDEEKRPDIIRDEGRKITYPLLEVVKSRVMSENNSILSSSSSSENSQELE